MTDEAWNRGLKTLIASLRDRDLTPPMADLRGATYRKALGHLTDEQWDWIVGRCIEDLTWFPTVHELLQYVPDARQSTVLALPAPRPTPEEIEARRQETRKGLEFVQAHLRERGIDLDAAVKLVPPARAKRSSEELRWDEERVRALQQQAREMLAATEAGEAVCVGAEQRRARGEDS